MARIIDIFFAIAILVLLLPHAASPSEPFSRDSETIRLRTVTGDGKVLGEGTIEIRREGDAVSIMEDRQVKEKGIRDTFHVVVDPKTFVPKSWRKDHTENGATTHTEMKVEKGKLVAKISKESGEPETQTTDKPQEPFLIEPLFKFYMARMLESGKAESRFRMVVLAHGFFKAIEVEVKDLGVETVTVPAGTFKCHRLTMKPASPFFAAIVPAGDMCLAADGTHPMVLGEGSENRASPRLKTELVSYETH